MKAKYLSTISLILLLFSVASKQGTAQNLKQLRFFMQPGSVPSATVPYGNNARAGHYLKTQDAKIYYETYGKGDPLVILHGGIVGSTVEMATFIDSLSTRYKVIAISTRGHGKSEMGSEIPSYERKAEDVSAIIDAVTKDSAIVLGFSDGAYTGYYLAAIHPAKVKKLVAIGAGEWKQGFRSYDMTRKTLWSLDSLYFKQQIALMPEPEKFDAWLVTVNRYYSSISVGKDILGAIQCPVLVMAGELDQNAPLRTVIAAYEMIPHAQLSIVPNAPHPVFTTNFSAVWASMNPFLRQ